LVLLSAFGSAFFCYNGRVTKTTKLRIGTRGSELALWQARHIAGLLGGETEIVIIKTEGDEIQGPLNDKGGKGLFVKAIEDALLAGRVDIAVHSLKDMPAELPPGLVIGAVPERVDPWDVIVTRNPNADISKPALDALLSGARVGTGSLRRICQLRALRPDLDLVPMRGNVPTRLRRVAEGACDAVVVAYAGMARLGRLEVPWARLPILPAVGQGAIAVECRVGEESLIAQIEHAPSRIAIDAERAFLAKLEGGCQVPIAGHATLSGDTLQIEGLVGSLDGTTILRESGTGPSKDATAIGRAAAERLLERGAAEILKGGAR
jgi:hydroxymethylbilane synthase